MAFRIYNSVDMVVILDDSTWEVEKFEKGGMWYSYKSTDAPILYSIYQRTPERPLILNEPCSSFKTKSGEGFENDLLLQDYLDEVLASKELEVNLETIKRGNENFLKTIDQSSEIVLGDILEEIKVMNIHLSLITGEEIIRP